MTNSIQVDIKNKNNFVAINGIRLIPNVLDQIKLQAEDILKKVYLANNKKISGFYWQKPKSPEFRATGGVFDRKILPGDPKKADERDHRSPNREARQLALPRDQHLIRDKKNRPDRIREDPSQHNQGKPELQQPRNNPDAPPNGGSPGLRLHRHVSP